MSTYIKTERWEQRFSRALRIPLNDVRNQIIHDGGEANPQLRSRNAGYRTVTRVS
jgi:hypothetical protein